MCAGEAAVGELAFTAKHAGLVEMGDMIPARRARGPNEPGGLSFGHMADIVQTNGGGDMVSVNLDIKNPNRKDDLEHLPPHELAESILGKEKQIAELMDEIKGWLAKGS